MPVSWPSWKAQSKSRNKSMTKIQLPFSLRRPLDDSEMNRIASLYGAYGILRIHVEGTDLQVEYDATRFSPKDVEAALSRAGLPLTVRSI